MSTDRDLMHPRDAIMRTMERIYRYRMTTTSGGNLSIRDDDNSIWITPARLDKGSLRRDDIVLTSPPLGLTPCDFLMDEPSVMATENALMAAALTRGPTVIRNARLHRRNNVQALVNPSKIQRPLSP